MGQSRMTRLKHRLLLSVLLVITATLSSCSSHAAVSTRNGFAMGSLVTVRIYGFDESSADRTANEIFAAVNALDAQISAVSESGTIKQINDAGIGKIGEPGFSLIVDSVLLCRTLGGKLDVSLGAVTELWGFSGETPAVPPKAALNESLAHTGLDNVSWDTDTGTVALSNGVRLDLGAIGKGAGCDEAKTVLERYQTPAVLSLGGTVLVYGKKPIENDPWTVGIRDPKQGADSYFATLSLLPDGETDAFFISTSGTYEKTFVKDGIRYHHLLDPKTGYPAKTDLVSVTAVAKEGWLSDALSTALLLNGWNETAEALVDRYLVGAVFRFENGETVITPGLQDSFRFTEGT